MSAHPLPPLPSTFHPAVATWFARCFGAPTAVQAAAWPRIAAGLDTLIAAPTGSGKTLAAFLAAIDGLVREGLASALPDETRVLYVSPLRALSNDIEKNLQQPLHGIAEAIQASGLPAVNIHSWVRTGDTPAGERQRAGRTPPHIVVTTPESLYLLLTSASGRRMLATVRTVIVDEIHALAATKRGAHLALSLARLDALTGRRAQRIGLSATQSPLQEIAAFLTGRPIGCAVVDAGHQRAWDLALELPDTPLDAVMSNAVWDEIHDRLAERVRAHRTTLVFVNTRRLCERLARQLAERLGREAVGAHHGSLAREHRLDAETRLKSGALRVLVATASLELGIDIGEVDLVCQIGSPRAINPLLQRVGRSGHGVGRIPKGRLFPLSRDDLVECTALLAAVRSGALDQLQVPTGALDVLAQQIVAEVAARGEIAEDDLWRQVTAAWPYRALARGDFAQVLDLLSDGVTTRRGRRSAHLFRDPVAGWLRPRRGARLAALLNGGAIPDLFDYDVVLQPEGLRVGTVNEDFAFESLAGDIFQLGNRAYRILRVETGQVHVADAGTAPPGMPFWLGEAPGRSDALSEAVSRLNATVEAALAAGGLDQARTCLARDYGLSLPAADQLAQYLGAAYTALGALPTRRHLILERFIDEVGDPHLVIHSPFGARLNRAFGLALRKRFCRQFNFELQAAALEDSLILSLGPTHQFDLLDVPRYLHSRSVRGVLSQALLDAPFFATRWRWVATTALTIARRQGGRRRPPQFQRQDAEDLIALVFPDQLACLENIQGEREIPDHPLIAQTLRDCMEEVMDAAGLERLLAELESGAIRVSGRDLPAPSPLAAEILSARPYAFLDDGAAEERRTRSVSTRGAVWAAAASDAPGFFEDAVLAAILAQIRPAPRDAEELLDALQVLGFLTEAEGLACHPQSAAWLEVLIEDSRARRVAIAGAGTLWVARERLAEVRAVCPDARIDGASVPEPAASENPALALQALLAGRLAGCGPVSTAALAAPLGRRAAEVEPALAALASQGEVIAGAFTAPGTTEWCERRVLIRLQRASLQQRRARQDPVPPRDFQRFLFRWHGLDSPPSGEASLSAALDRLAGCSAPAGTWERHLLPARVAGFTPAALDALLAQGRYVWLRLDPPAPDDEGRPRFRSGSLRQIPLALLPRAQLAHWRHLAPPTDPARLPLSGAARSVLDLLDTQGALFYEELALDSRLLPAHLETALAELVGWGLITADGFAGFRRRAVGARRSGRLMGGRRDNMPSPLARAGRWSRLRPMALPDAAPARFPSQPLETLEQVARTLLSRYGVVFKTLLARESPLPPWRELLYVLWRLEAQGEVLGGRFIEGISGEQFALPEAAGLLREVARQAPAEERVTLSAADPLNLAGILTPGERTPALAGRSVCYLDGLPIDPARSPCLGTLDQENRIPRGITPSKR